MDVVTFGRASNRRLVSQVVSFYNSVITLRVIFKVSIFRVCLVVSVFYLCTKEAVQGAPIALDVSRGKTYSKPSNLA